MTRYYEAMIIPVYEHGSYIVRASSVSEAHDKALKAAAAAVFVLVLTFWGHDNLAFSHSICLHSKFSYPIPRVQHWHGRIFGGYGRHLAQNTK